MKALLALLAFSCNAHAGTITVANASSLTAQVRVTENGVPLAFLELGTRAIHQLSTDHEYEAQASVRIEDMVIVSNHVSFTSLATNVEGARLGGSGYNLGLTTSAHEGPLLLTNHENRPMTFSLRRDGMPMYVFQLDSLEAREIPLDGKFCAFAEANGESTGEICSRNPNAFFELRQEGNHIELVEVAP
jgi:hypothetical protein